MHCVRTIEEKKLFQIDFIQCKENNSYFLGGGMNKKQ